MVERRGEGNHSEQVSTSQRTRGRGENGFLCTSQRTRGQRTLTASCDPWEVRERLFEASEAFR